MKNKEFLMRTFVLAVIWIWMIWQVLLLLTTPRHQFSGLFREIALMVFLAWVVSIIFRQNRDDDDWVGQY